MKNMTKEELIAKGSAIMAELKRRKDAEPRCIIEKVCIQEIRKPWSASGSWDKEYTLYHSGIQGWRSYSHSKKDAKVYAKSDAETMLGYLKKELRDKEHWEIKIVEVS